jgi:hypothetical protein
LKKYDSHYGNFDVMNEKEEWDPHTREIVEKRTSANLGFEGDDSKLLYDVCSILLDESRPPVLQFIVYHFHTKFAAEIGEAQRKKGVQKEALLIQTGLQDLQTFSLQHFNKTFSLLEESEKKDIIKKIADGTLPPDVGKNLSKDFFKKFLSLSVEAFYSHPDVWSEIGYAGPAYPRGYVRTELGLTDPWEAKRDDK